MKFLGPCIEFGSCVDVGGVTSVDQGVTVDNWFITGTSPSVQTFTFSNLARGRWTWTIELVSPTSVTTHGDSFGGAAPYPTNTAPADRTPLAPGSVCGGLETLHPGADPSWYVTDGPPIDNGDGTFSQAWAGMAPTVGIGCCYNVIPDDSCCHILDETCDLHLADWDAAGYTCASPREIVVEFRNDNFFGSGLPSNADYIYLHYPQFTSFRILGAWSDPAP